MKKIFVLTCIIVFNSFVAFAQDTTCVNRGVFTKVVPQKLNIKDKIILQNQTPYLILQAVVALQDETGKYVPLANTAFLAPNETIELIDFADNGLKKLRGRQLSIKIKGSKKIFGTNSTSVYTPRGSVGVHHRDLDPEIINNIKSEDIVYDFDAVLYEANHDLYIQVMYKGEGKSIMDF